MTPDEAARAASARRYVARSDGRLTVRLEKVLALIGRALDFPGVRITVLDEHLQHTIGVVGPALSRSLPRDSAICDEVVRTGSPLGVPDAVTDPRFADLPEVRAGLTGSYLGVPLHGRESLVIGAVCVTDPQARRLDDQQVRRMQTFAAVVERVLEIQRRAVEQSDQPVDPADPTPRVTLGPDAPRLLRAAIDAHRIEPAYKPVVDLATERLRGFEVTPRWSPPGRPTDDARWLVPGARDTDLLLALDYATLAAALPDLARWTTTRPRLTVTAPMSARLLADDRAPDRLTAMTAAAGVDPLDVDLLLTESAQWSPTSAAAIANATALRDLGFGLHLQDYGSGWTALDQLLWLPADAVKIDASLTAALGTRVGDALAGGIIALARAMGMRVVIGGLSSPAAADIARTLGARDGLGDLWGPAVPTSAADALVANGVEPAWSDHRVER